MEIPLLFIVFFYLFDEAEAGLHGPTLLDLRSLSEGLIRVEGTVSGGGVLAGGGTSVQMITQVSLRQAQ